MDLSQYLATEPPHLPLLRFLFKDKPLLTLLDVGSCEGEDSWRYLNVFQGCRIHAFEPYPDNAQKIRSLIGPEFQNRFTLVEAAISDCDGEAVLNISSGHPPGLPQCGDWDYGNKSSSLLSPAGLMQRFHPWLHFKKHLKVQTICVDSYVKRMNIDTIDFIHMDIQGAELKALQGARHTLPRTGVIWVEVSDQSIYEGQPTSSEISEYLAGYGFELILSCMSDGFGDNLYVNPAYYSVTPRFI